MADPRVTGISQSPEGLPTAYEPDGFIDGQTLLTRIAAIDRILRSGASSISVDGVTTAINIPSLREERKRLAAIYDREFGRVAKPVIRTVTLSNSF